MENLQISSVEILSQVKRLKLEPIILHNYVKMNGG